MTKHRTGVPPVSSTYCMTHDNHTRSVVRALENRRERETRNSESGLVSVVCVSIGALHDDGGRGTVSARLACAPANAQFLRRGPLHSPGSLGCQAQAHTHLILIYDNHTRQVPLSFRKSGDPKPGTSWTRVCVKVVLPSSYRPWRRAYRYGPETGGSMRQSEQGPSRPAYRL
jgi:hypothetical protein